jgi:hypothetical protein
MTLTDSIERCLKKGNAIVLDRPVQNQQGIGSLLTVTFANKQILSRVD